MIKKLFTHLPEWMRRPLRGVHQRTALIPYRGRDVFCPVCGRYARKFGDYGLPPRPDARCVYCQSLERHRLVWLYFQQRTDLFDGRPKRLLHLAAEACFIPRLRHVIGTGYTTADLMDPQAMLRMDITHIPHPAQAFDVIYCSHVLEHVPDDRQAIRELYRVLKPGGWAVILLPVKDEKTYEDASITLPAERLKAFGQADHVRIIGADYADRLREPGFDVQVFYAADLFNPSEITRLGLTTPSGIFCCSKGHGN